MYLSFKSWSAIVRSYDLSNRRPHSAILVYAFWRSLYNLIYMRPSSDLVSGYECFSFYIGSAIASFTTSKILRSYSLKILRSRCFKIVRSWVATFYLHMDSSLLRDREILSCYFLLLYVELATEGSWDLELLPSTYIWIARYWGIVRSWVATLYLYMYGSWDQACR